MLLADFVFNIFAPIAGLFLTVATIWFYLSLVFFVRNQKQGPLEAGSVLDPDNHPSYKN